MSCDYTINMSDPSSMRRKKGETICWHNPNPKGGRTLTATPSKGWPWGGKSSIAVAPGHTVGPYLCENSGDYPYNVGQGGTNPVIVVTP